MRSRAKRKHRVIRRSERLGAFDRTGSCFRGLVFFENDVNTISINAERTDAGAARLVRAVSKPELRLRQHAETVDMIGRNALPISQRRQKVLVQSETRFDQ